MLRWSLNRCGSGLTCKQKTYNTEDSLVVTDPTTDSALTSLTRGERTGSRTFLWIWSYVVVSIGKESDMGCGRESTHFRAVRQGFVMYLGVILHAYCTFNTMRWVLNLLKILLSASKAQHHAVSVPFQESWFRFKVWVVVILVDLKKWVPLISLSAAHTPVRSLVHRPHAAGIPLQPCELKLRGRFHSQAPELPSPNPPHHNPQHRQPSPGTTGFTSQLPTHQPSTPTPTTTRYKTPKYGAQATKRRGRASGNRGIPPNTTTRLPSSSHPSSGSGRTTTTRRPRREAIHNRLQAQPRQRRPDLGQDRRQRGRALPRHDAPAHAPAGRLHGLPRGRRRAAVCLLRPRGQLRTSTSSTPDLYLLWLINGFGTAIQRLLVRVLGDGGAVCSYG